MKYEKRRKPLQEYIYTHTHGIYLNNKIEWVVVLRAISCIAIVMIHVIAGWLNNEHGQLSVARNFLDTVIMQMLIRFAVPCFIMISGYLLLDPKRELTTKKLRGYILKMILILILFGLSYNLMENIFTYGLSNIFNIILKSLLSVFSEDVWAHLWYIYMLIGLYIITPILRTFVEKTDESTARYVIYGLFIVSIIIPTINEIFNIKITSFYLESFKYVLIYLLGYYIANTDIVKDKYIYIGGITGIIGYLCLCYFIPNSSATNMFIILESILIFKLFSSGKINMKCNTILNSISKYSLGIYLIHPFYLNLLYKIIKILPDTMPILIGELAIWIYAITLSLISSIILYKIPIIKKLFK